MTLLVFYANEKETKTKQKTIIVILVVENEHNILCINGIIWISSLISLFNFYTTNSHHTQTHSHKNKFLFIYLISIDQAKISTTQKPNSIIIIMAFRCILNITYTHTQR